MKETNEPNTTTAVTEKPKFSVERKVESIIPQSSRLPNVTGGLCDYCGVKDNKQPAHLQYTLCEHYKGIQLKCSYCPPGTDWVDVTLKRQFTVHEYPVGSGSLTVVCDDYRCRDKHFKRFEKGRTI